MKKHSRILAACMAMALASVTLLSACTNPTPAASQPGTPASSGAASSGAPDYSNVTLSMVLAKGWDTNGREALLQKYTEKTGVQFDVQILPDDMASELIKTKFSTNELPDIIMNSGSVLEHTYMLPEERLVDLTAEPWVDQLVNKDSFTVDNKVWGLPMGGQGYFAFAVNTKVFKDNGLEIPTSKKELEACFEVLKKNGVQPMYLGAKDLWLVGNMTSGGIAKALEKDPELINKLNTNQIKYAEIPGMIEAFADLRRWNELGYLGNNTMADSWDGEFKAFAEDKCGVTVGLTTWDVQMEQKFPGATDKMALIPFYLGDCDTYFAGTTAQWYIPKSGKNVEVVKDFFRFVTENENLNDFYKAMGEPATPWKDVTVECLAPTKQVIDNLNSGKYSYHVGHNSLVQGQDFDGLCKLAQEALIGTKTAEEAVAEYDVMRSKIAKALGLQGF